MSRADEIADLFPEEDLVQMDGFDDCIIGYTELLNESPKLCYSVELIIQALMRQMDFDSAWEHFAHNIDGNNFVVLVHTTP